MVLCLTSLELEYICRWKSHQEERDSVQKGVNGYSSPKRYSEGWDHGHMGKWAFNTTDLFRQAGKGRDRNLLNQTRCSRTDQIICRLQKRGFDKRFLNEVSRIIHEKGRTRAWLGPTGPTWPGPTYLPGPISHHIFPPLCYPPPHPPAECHPPLLLPLRRLYL